MQVRVFRNLTSKCLSIQARTRTGWRTVAHADQVELIDAAFNVSEAGRLRVVASGKKTVHAWVCGTLTAWRGTVRLADHAPALPMASGDCAPALGARVSYNPHKGPEFRVYMGPIYTAQRVHLSTASGVSVAG